MSKRKMMIGARQDYPEDCLYCPNYRGEKRGCRLKKCTGGGERRGSKPQKRGRSRWDG